MLDKITPKEPEEWEHLCRIQNVLHPSTVHHFERGENHEYFPVLWSDVDVEKSATERELDG